MRILLLGKGGQLGRCLLERLAPLGELIPFGGSDADFRETRLLRELVREVFPGVIVNAAAYTAVDRAETDVETAMAVNAAAPGVLAQEAERIGAGLVHFSTDYVFDGRSNRPYTEGDLPNPLSVYGESKLLGEMAIASTEANYLIMRTSWVFGASGRNFLTNILRLARERKELTLVYDQIVGPTWARWIADATAAILSRIDPTMPGGARRYFRDHRGLYHLAALGATTPDAFAREILRHDPWRNEHKTRVLHTIHLADYPAAAKRPPYAILDSSLASESLGVELQSWSTQLDQCFSGVTPAEAASFREPGLGH